MSKSIRHKTLRILNGIRSEVNRFKRISQQPAHWTEETYVSTEDPIILTGAGRSGTTLMSVILNAHSDIFCGAEYTLLAQERLNFAHIASTFKIEESQLAELARSAVNQWQFLEMFIRRMKDQHGIQRFATKNPIDVFNLASIFAVFPNAQVVYMCRDGRDIAISMQENVKQIGLRYDAQYDEEGVLAIQYCAENWRTFINAYRRWENDSRCILVKYEDLVSEPEVILKSLCKFLGICYQESMLDFQGIGMRGRDDVEQPHLVGLKKPLYKDKIYRWKNIWSHEQVASFEQYAGKELNYLGYELLGEGGAK